MRKIQEGVKILNPSQIEARDFLIGFKKRNLIVIKVGSLNSIEINLALRLCPRKMNRLTIQSLIIKDRQMCI